MSIYRMAAVWKDSGHKGSALLLLLALADNADDDGFCWPGIEHLAAKIRMTPQSVINLSKKLEESGEIYIDHNRRRGNRYLVTVGLNEQEVRLGMRKFGYAQDKLEIRTKKFLIKMGFSSELKDSFNSELKHALEEPSINHQRTINGANAPQDTPPHPEPDWSADDVPTDQLLEQAHTAGLSDEDILGPPKGNGELEVGTWQERLHGRQQEPHFQLERMSKVVAKYSPPVGVDRDAVLRVVWMLYEQHAPLNLNKPKEVRWWLTEAAALVGQASGSMPVIERALREHLDEGLSLKSPKSLAYKIGDILRSQETQQAPKRMRSRREIKPPTA